MTSDERIENCENAIYRLAVLLNSLAFYAESVSGIDLTDIHQELKEIKEKI